MWSQVIPNFGVFGATVMFVCCTRVLLPRSRSNVEHDQASSAPGLHSLSIDSIKIWARSVIDLWPVSSNVEWP